MIDAEVRRVVYETAMRSGRIPLAEEIASALSVDRNEIADAFRRLAEAHIVVLQRDRDEILMAMPFSAVPTPFVVESGGMRAYANCMWDALGIPAMLHADATIATSCRDGGDPDRGGRSGEGRRVRSLRAAGEAVVERRRLHVKDDPLLPVGRTRRSLV
jgi:hypothetical protein